MQTTIEYIITITPVSDSGLGNIIINNNESRYNQTQYNLGWFIDLTSMSLANSITELNIPSEFNFTLNNYDISIQPQIDYLMNNIEGSYIQVTAKNNEGLNISKCIYSGYVSAIPSSMNLKSGSQFTLIANTLLSQLSTMSSSGSWNDSTQNYNAVFTTIANNHVPFKQLLEDILKGTLLESHTFHIFDYGLPPMPTEVWANIIPSNNKLQVLREILIPYNRIVFQSNNGSLFITPLCYTRYSNTSFNINAEQNSGNFIAISSISNACKIINRVDCQFGVTAMNDMYGLNTVDNEDNQNIYTSAPNIDKATNKITAPSNNALDYTKVYKKSTNLYNSGKFIMPVLINPVIGDGLLNDPIMLNAFNAFLTNSVILTSPKGSQDKYQLAKMYAQLFLAETNVNNYNASIIYDYTKLIDSTDPLATVVTIDNYSFIDYKQMLIDKTIISVHSQTGSTMEVSTIPLLSMTGVWANGTT